MMDGQKSDMFVPYGDLQPRERGSHEKRWDYSRCRSLLTCVLGQFQADAFIEALVEAGNAGDENVAKITITLGTGNKLVLSGRVFPTGVSVPDEMCPA
ncbi:hypothetical protein MFIFM68171_01988 [Madurella fahalii]|uniref:Uncharacterized protein n=1 Tax=Madurella fahalii TaxID=1157608 RepID=A0ABQ0G1Z3_9PEZI